MCCQEGTAAEQKNADANNEAAIEVLHQLWRQRNDDELRHSEPDEDCTNLRGIVAMNLSQVQRQDEHDTIEADSQSHVEDAAQPEVSAGKQAQVDEWFFFMELDENEGRYKDRRNP